MEHGRIDGGHFAHQPVGAVAIGAGFHQAAVTATQPHGPPAHFVEAIDDVLVDPANEHHLHHVHRGGGGDPEAVTKFGLDVESGQPVVDFRPTAVHHHRLNSHRGQQHQIAVHRVAQLG